MEIDQLCQVVINKAKILYPETKLTSSFVSKTIKNILADIGKNQKPTRFLIYILYPTVRI